MEPKAKTFYFEGYSFDKKNLKISFNYRVAFSNRSNLNFTESIILPRTPNVIPPQLLRKILESTHLALGISYYKLYCPAEIKTSFKLSIGQAKFWDKVYRKGLGEFLYKNKLSPDKLAKFPHSKVKTSPVNLKNTDHILLGIGGGKDSIVAAELLRDFPVTSFLVETQKKDPVSQNIIKKIGNPSLKIKRHIDSGIFETPSESYNGHVPISMMFAFLGILSAALYGYKYAVVGNEHSSNFGNIKYFGETINHQWSKSLEFEKMLQKYTKEFITPDIIYFSILRQFYEIRAVELFSKHNRYFNTFSSCNRNFKVYKSRGNSLWCGKCPKCAFVFLLLSPFINKKELLNIFKKDLFGDKKLIPIFRDILGLGLIKPFDCVGTFEEAQVALFMASQKYRGQIIVKTFLSKIKTSKKMLKQVFETVPTTTIPNQFQHIASGGVG